MDEKTLGQQGYEAYGEKAGAHGPWKTFDGRPMPKWEELTGEAGELTKARWEEAAVAILREHVNYLFRKYPDSNGGAIGTRCTGA